MNKLSINAVLFSAAVAAFAGQASAADLPAATPIHKAPAVVAPVTVWTGCYVGGNVGGAWSRSHVTWIPNPAGFVVSAPDLATDGTGRINSSGVVAGGQVGCNWQSGSFVIGGEGDIQYTDLRATRIPALTGVLAATGSPITETFQSHWLATIRGRLGWAADSFLLYVTGGVAFAEANFSDLVVFPVSTTQNFASSNTTRTGWTVGVGGEYKFTPNWSVKAEYLYADLGSVNYVSANSDAAAFPLSTIVHQHNFQENIVRVGVNYYFGGPIVARY